MVSRKNEARVVNNMVFRCFCAMLLISGDRSPLKERDDFQMPFWLGWALTEVNCNSNGWISGEESRWPVSVAFEGIYGVGWEAAYDAKFS